MTPTAFSFQIDGLTAAGLRCGTRGARPVLALHGWLDNAASFIPLAQALAAQPLDLVLLDLPGHGRSDPLPPGSHYQAPGAICHVLDVADALDWQRFSLIGHSMGGGIASLIAASAPERIAALVTIEALGGLSAPVDETATRLRDYISAVRRLPGRNLRVFADLAAPIRARMMANQLSEASARLLVERGVDPVPGGYRWSTDPRLMLPTPVRPTDAQIDDLIAAIVCPTQVIYASPAQDYFPDAVRLHRASLLQHGQLQILPGHHHLHMDDAPQVAAVIEQFFAAY